MGVMPAASGDSTSTLSVEPPDHCSLQGLPTDCVSQFEDHLLGLLSEAGLGPVLIAHGNDKLLGTGTACLSNDCQDSCVMSFVLISVYSTGNRKY